jgi:hypothetical protein
MYMSLNGTSSPSQVATLRRAKARVHAAVAWILGEVEIDRSVANAVAIFKRSPAHISAALRLAKGQADPLAAAWARATPTQRAEFPRASFAGLEAAIDRATAPSRALNGRGHDLHA